MIFFRSCLYNRWRSSAWRRLVSCNWATTDKFGHQPDHCRFIYLFCLQCSSSGTGFCSGAIEKVSTTLFSLPCSWETLGSWETVAYRFQKKALSCGIFQSVYLSSIETSGRWSMTGLKLRPGNKTLHFKVAQTAAARSPHKGFLDLIKIWNNTAKASICCQQIYAIAHILGHEHELHLCFQFKLGIGIIPIWNN